RCPGDTFREVSPILVEVFLAARNDLRDDREAVARGSLGKNWAISSLLHFVWEEATLRDGHGCGFRPIVLLLCVCHIASLFGLFVFCFLKSHLHVNARPLRDACIVIPETISLYPQRIARIIGP